MTGRLFGRLLRLSTACTRFSILSHLHFVHHPPCSGGAVRTWWWRWWSVWTFLGFNRTQPCTPQSDQAESPCKYFFLKKTLYNICFLSQAEIYLLLAARLRLSWPRLPKLLQRRCLLAAARIADKSDVDGELGWLVGHHGRQFFLNETWTLDSVEACWGLTSPPPALQPVAQIVRAFRNSFLQSALHTINCPTAGSQLTEVLPTLAAVSRSNQLLGSLTGDRHDPVADWWTSLLSCSAHWSLDNATDAELTFSDIDQLPALYQVQFTFFRPMSGSCVPHWRQPTFRDFNSGLFGQPARFCPLL